MMPVAKEVHKKPQMTSLMRHLQYQIGKLSKETGRFQGVVQNSADGNFEPMIFHTHTYSRVREIIHHEQQSSAGFARGFF